MSRAALCHPARVLWIVLALAVGGGVARAQGTPEQRMACMPDALRLCSDTIPDVDRTIACMKAHRRSLSPACVAASAPAPSVVRAKPRMAGRVAARRLAALPRRSARLRRKAVARNGGARASRAMLGHLCGTGLLDRRTCALIGGAVDVALGSAR